MTAFNGAPTTTQTLTVWRSRLDLSLRAQAACGNVDQLHRVVLAGFTPAPGEERTSVVFAAQRSTPSRAQAKRGEAGRPQKVLVQSLTQPDWSHLEDGGLVTGTATRQFHEHYRAGEQIAIRIIANPAFRERDTGKRKAHGCAADQARWLSRRMLDNGFDTGPDRIALSAPAAVTGRKKDGRRIHVATCDFMAQGTVLDAALFHQAVIRGVGPGKAYGCGLLITGRIA